MSKFSGIIHRQDYQFLHKRIQEPAQFLQVIAGPRQVGKTTLAKAISEQCSFPVHFVAADETHETGATWISQQWENARFKMKANNQQEGLLIIDEIQKIKDWSRQVKAEWDRDRKEGLNLRALLLGSPNFFCTKG